jgi:stage V sporulation protein AC
MKPKPKPTPEQKQYGKLVKERMPKTKLGFDCLKAFVVGGLICMLGQLVNDVGKYVFLFPVKEAATFTSIVMIFIGITLTGIGVYDKIGSFAGAGSIVPITGFANSMASPAMEFRREGFVMGLAAKMFIVAGPVLVYGIGASIVVGLITLLVG